MPRPRPAAVTVQLGPKSVDELDAALSSHEALLEESHTRLRDRLQRERTARDQLRQAKLLNEYIVRKIESHRANTSGIVTGGASDAFSWRNIEDRRDVDTRIKRFKQTEQCEVIDVTAWVREKAAASGQSVKKLNLSRVTGIVEKPALSARSVRDMDDGRGSPRDLLRAGTLTSRTGSFSARSGATRRQDGSPTPAPGRGSSRSGRQSTIDIRAPANEPTPTKPRGKRSNANGTQRKLFGSTRADKKARGLTGLRAHITGTVLPALATGSGITARGVMQCELDFMSLSYGRSHITLETLTDLGAEYVVDYGHRRVLILEFMEYMRHNKITELPLTAFIHIVHPRWQRSSIPSMVASHAPNLGWAVGLPFELAECINHIWVQAEKEVNDEGVETISFDEFARLTKVESSVALDYDDVRTMFFAIDEDGNGTLDKHEFARFIAGKVNMADVTPPEQLANDDDVDPAAAVAAAAAGLAPSATVTSDPAEESRRADDGA